MYFYTDDISYGKLAQTGLESSSMADKEYLTAAEVAAELRVNAKTIIRWIQSGYLPAIKVGKYYRIPRKQYEEFLKRRHIQPPDTPSTE